MATKTLDGMPFPAFFPEENFYLMKNLPLRDNDVLLTTYPKCGTNWVAYILYGIFHPEELPADAKKVQDYCAFVDNLGLLSWKDSADHVGRSFMTHLPFDYLQWNPRTKYVTVIRNPMDCCVSLFHFLKQLPGAFTGEKPQQEIPDEFFYNFLSDGVIYGNYFKHLKTLYERKDEANVHMMVFETMKANPREEILKLARFLGRADKLEANKGELLDKLVEQSSFGSMKKNMQYKGPSGKEVNVLRKGEVGGYRESLTSDQIKVLKEKLNKEMAGTEILDLWRDV